MAAGPLPRSMASVRAAAAATSLVCAAWEHAVGPHLRRACPVCCAGPSWADPERGRPVAAC